MFRLAGLALAAALLIGGAAAPSAQDGRYESRFDIPERPRPARLVNDFAGALSPMEADALERKLVAFDDSTGSQIAVVTVPTTNGVAPVDYATEILREWGVGRAGIDDGVVVLVATRDREVFIATGLGAEGALTDATAGTIVRSVIVPAFRQGQFYAGLDGATDAIAAALAGEFEPPSAVGGGGGDLSGLLCLLFLVFILLVVIASRQQAPPSSGGGGRRRRRGPGVIVIAGGGWGGGFGGSSGGFGGGFGGGGFGGGFGGFGGGFGGGGGAGGSW